ncbi:hypothetical protein BKA65DRAFT_534611 [Rhexocercosporidium sp. MPI-PUGE-AT-0058]|nr:hypothetical protein BKA65DRAFT_534611 [Rhexocercosporidium sp. MPI-PUGE-AT-0058]
MVGKRKKAMRAKAEATIAAKAARRGGNKQERRAHKLEKRKQEKKNITAEMWAAPAPTHLVAKLDQPKLKSKYQSYFEFADNPERKKKKLEVQVTKQSLDKYPGYAFVPVGDPDLTNQCKELSRDQDAMIFIVSTHTQNQDNTKISEHVHRTGYYFREAIVDQAREIIGETVISNPTITPGTVEPIPESQDEINKQADKAIRDLFPRIPNPDRVMIIEHAFKKGAMFHGEPTVGLQAGIPLSRRVQLAVLAHVRHTHTRYDKLLRETTWMNARKAVEPVCLDILIKWRGDEETGRDQMDEILREVVIITDSEDEDDSSEEDSSDEEGEVTSVSSTEPPTQPNSRNQQRPPVAQPRPSANIPAPVPATQTNSSAISSRTRAKDPREKKEQRGFKRYQAAWQDAINRRQAPRSHTGTPYQESEVGRPQSMIAAHAGSPRYTLGESSRAEPIYIQHRPSGPLRSEVNVPHSERAVYYPDVPHQHHESPRNVPYQSVPQQFGATGNSQYPTMGYQPPQVVRRSPVKHGLQDFLVPSIETVSSDVSSPRIHEWNGPRAHDAHDAINRSRVVGTRAQTPAAHQVIVIDDDSPHVKRRRLVRDDESGHFRPLPSRDHSVHVPASHSDSLTLRSSSTVQPVSAASSSTLRYSRAPTQSTQGLLRNTEAFYTDPLTRERLPIYDAPEPGYVPKRPGEMDRGEGGFNTVQREDDSGLRPKRHSHPVDDLYHRRPINMQSNSEMPALNTRGNGARHPESVFNPDHHMRQFSPGFSTSHQPSRSFDISARSGGPDQDFIQTFSQSRLDGPLLQSRDGFAAVSARSQQNVATPSNIPYQDNQAGSYAPIISSRARSPIRYVERPLKFPPRQVRELSQQPAYYRHEHPVRSDRQAYVNEPVTPLPERQPTSFGEVPIYVRTIPPPRRRPVIYLE